MCHDFPSWLCKNKSCCALDFFSNVTFERDNCKDIRNGDIGKRMREPFDLAMFMHNKHFVMQQQSFYYSHFLMAQSSIIFNRQHNHEHLCNPRQKDISINHHYNFTPTSERTSATASCIESRSLSGAHKPTTMCTKHLRGLNGAQYISVSRFCFPHHEFANLSNVYPFPNSHGGFCRELVGSLSFGWWLG